MTILYRKDFERYPKAIIDTQSKNTSWVEFAAKLKAMGVKNWGFHLTLLDPSLQGVDPRDPNLDRITILKIQKELKSNWWYYIREVFRVPSLSGGKPIYLNANRGNIAIYWCVFNSFITYAQQLRQTGKSLNTRAIVTGFHCAWARGSRHILFTKSDLRPDEIKEYKEIKASLPNYMYYHDSKDKDNQQDFTTLCHGNRTFTYIPSNDPDGANKVGRGKSPTLITVDEIPFLQYAHISIASLLASTTQSFDEAKAAKAFHAILYTTTAGDLSTEEGKFVYEMIKCKGMFFSEMLYDCIDRNDACEVIFANGNCRPAPYVTIAFNHLQLGYSDDWVKLKIATVPGSKDQHKRDFLGIWTFGSQENPIKEPILNVIRKHTNHDYIPERMSKYYNVRFHKPIEYVKDRKIALGLDTSEAIGRDAITGVGVDVETAETLLAFSINESNLIYFGSFLASFMKTFPNITLVPEAKSSWCGIRDQLLIELPKLGIDPGRRIYSTIVDNARSDERAKKEYKDYSSGYPSERKYYPYRNDFGYSTGRDSRETLLNDVMMNVTKEFPHLIRDPSLIDELSTLVMRKGRIDHALSGHDDHVISFSLAHWLLRYGRNLDHYGIDERAIMNAVTQVKEETLEERRKRDKQARIMTEIDTIMTRLESASSAIEISYLQSKLKVLRGEVSDVDDPTRLAGSLAARAADTQKVRKDKALVKHQPFFGRFGR